MEQVKCMGDTFGQSWEMCKLAGTGRAAFAEKRRRCTHGNENGKKHSGAN